MFVNRVSRGACLSLLLNLGACSAVAPSNEGNSSSESEQGSSNWESVERHAGAGCDSTSIGRAYLRRLTASELAASLRDVLELPESWVPTFSPDVESDLGFSTDESFLRMGVTITKESAKAAEEAADLVLGELEPRLSCAASNPDSDCAEEAFRRWGSRAFRRPVSDEEVETYVGHFENIAAKSDFATGIKWMIVAMLQAPQFLFRSEIGVAEGEERLLDHYEIASQLAYMYTGTIPDEALLARAAAGELDDPAVRREEAIRLLEGLVAESNARTSASVYRVVQTFFREWLSYQTVSGKTRFVAGTEFPQEISWRMVQETEMFLADLIFNENGTIYDLLQARVTFMDETLSQHYGFGDVTGEAFRRVERPVEHSQGILAQGSLLAAHSLQKNSSPVFRGLLFSEKFLCNETPEPPASIPSLEEATQDQSWNTNRERYELAHSGSAQCKNCHQAFEPFGFAFEEFNEAGQYRAVYEDPVTYAPGEFPVDASVTGLEIPGEEGTFYVGGLTDLSNLVDDTTRVQQCVADLLEAYSFSGGGGQGCLTAESHEAFVSGRMSIYEFLLAMSEMPHMSRRLR